MTSAALDVALVRRVLPLMRAARSVRTRRPLRRRQIADLRRALAALALADLVPDELLAPWLAWAGGVGSA